MTRSHSDLSVTSYGLIGLAFVGHEVLGLRVTLIICLALGAALLAITLTHALASHLCDSGRRLPHERVGTER